MTKPKKKAKTGDVVGWGVVNRAGRLFDTFATRKDARYAIAAANEWGGVKLYRIAKIVLAK